jgi:hypothetical protein
MLTRHIALISETPLIDASGLARVSAAIQRQVMQDLAPIWDVTASVDPFPTLEDMPPGYWPIVVTLREVGENLTGVHVDTDGHPIAWVEWSESWSLTASHECLEMLVDPWGNQLQTAPALQGDARVEYLLEVCDPCQASSFAYLINDTLVSDFYTPAYFDRVARGGARYSLTGSLEQPRQVLEQGYLTWRDLSDNHFYQMHGPAGVPQDLGPLKLGAAAGASLRELVDRATPQHLEPTRLSKAQVDARVHSRRTQAKAAARSRAARLRDSR